MTALKLRSIKSLSLVDAAAWDACAGSDNPFLLHGFLTAMEQSGSASGRSGWQGHHLLVEDSAGQLLAATPLYVKSHSYGEYVFDWGWAEAWQRSGRDYYPKLQSAIPFTPASGRRLLVRADQDQDRLASVLAGGIVDLVRQHRLSSAHITFLTEAEAKLLERQGWLLRLGEQFHWHNDGYGCFDDFLAALASRKRKAIRKERERANQFGGSIHCLTGADLRPVHWDAFYRFYLDTVEKKWAQAYLTRDFFDRLTGPLADRVVLMLAARDGEWVAGALNFLGSDTLFGRNWGALGDFRYLHFELCYYRAIDFAIERGLKRVEAGAQGDHKISRGYMPVPTYSVHWIREAPFRDAIADFITRETRLLQQQMQALSAQGPYRQAEGED